MITAKEFEEVVIYRSKTDERSGLYTLGRYGVKSTFIDGVWQPIPSLPDFEGAMADGRQFIFDTKRCAQASYDLSGSTHKSFKHQLKFMRRRAKFNVTCFVLIHFTERVLKTKTDPEVTIAFPIFESKFWEDYDAGKIKSLNREMAIRHGHYVPWNRATTRVKKDSPDILSAVEGVRKLIKAAQLGGSDDA